MSDVTENVVPNKPEQKNEPQKVVEKKPEPKPEVQAAPVTEVKPVPKVVSEPKEFRYKLNLYTDSGTVRPIFSGAVMRDVSRRYGDIMRALSSTRFMTEDEVCESVWIIERKMRYPTNRTRNQIRTAVQELIDRQIIVTD